MDTLENTFQQYSQKIILLNEFITLYGNQRTILPDLLELQTNNGELGDLINKANKALQEFRAELLPQAQFSIQRMDRVETIVLNMIEEMCEEEYEKTDAQVNKENSFCTTPKKNILATKSLSLADYTNSPFTRKMKPTSLQFIDFEANISHELFAKIPQYMKGRECLEELTDFLENVIIKCFNLKYTLFFKHRAVVQNQHDLNMWKHYQQQSEYFPNQMFITQGDITSLTGKMIDKKTANRIGMLRHIQIISEQRHKTTVCYIWQNK